MSTYLSTEEAAQRTKLSRQTLAQLRVRGDGPPFIKVGARVLYPANELEAWLNAHTLHYRTVARLDERDVSPS